MFVLPHGFTLSCRSSCNSGAQVPARSRICRARPLYTVCASQHTPGSMGTLSTGYRCPCLWVGQPPTTTTRKRCWPSLRTYGNVGVAVVGCRRRLELWARMCRIGARCGSVRSVVCEGYQANITSTPANTQRTPGTTVLLSIASMAAATYLDTGSGTRILENL